MSLENELLQEEIARGSGSNEENKRDDISGEGGGSGDEKSSHVKQEPDRPVSIKKPVKPDKPVNIPKPVKPAKSVTVPASAKLTSNKTTPEVNTKPQAPKPKNAQIQKKPAPGEVKKDTPAKAPATDKRFSKLIGSNVACRLVGKKGFKSGSLRWVGHLPRLPVDNAHLIAGVELSTDDKLGTDGTYRGVRYFKSSPKRGYFFRLKDCKALKH